MIVHYVSQNSLTLKCFVNIVILMSQSSIHTKANVQNAIIHMTPSIHTNATCHTTNHIQFFGSTNHIKRLTMPTD